MPTDNESEAETLTRRFRFSLRGLLAVVTIVCLALALLITFFQLSRIRQELAQANQQLQAMRPLAPEEVAAQLEEQTNYVSATGKVQDVRYSAAQDEYLVRFAYTIKKTGQTSMTEIRLKGDGFGQWAGAIQSPDFAAATGVASGNVYVLVKTPSSLNQK